VRWSRQTARWPGRHRTVKLSRSRTNQSTQIKIGIPYLFGVFAIIPFPTTFINEPSDSQTWKSRIDFLALHAVGSYLNFKTFFHQENIHDKLSGYFSYKLHLK
jgi:hypothetical protein